MKMRASSAPMAYLCGQSQRRPEGEIFVDPRTFLAQLGTGNHEANSVMVHGRQPDLALIAEKYNADYDQIVMCYNMSKQIWHSDNVAPFFTGANIETEKAFEAEWWGHHFTGHLDVYNPNDDFNSDACYILDWKLDNIYRAYWQMVIYAYLAMQHSGKNRCYVYIGSILQGKTIIYEFAMKESGDIDEVHNDVAVKVDLLDELIKAAQDDTYHPGEACTYCPRRTSCPGKIQMVQSTMSEAHGITSLDSMREIIESGDFAEFEAKWKMAKQALDDLRELRNDTIREIGTPVEDGLKTHYQFDSGDKTYQLKEEVHRRNLILTPQVIDYFDEHYGPENLCKLIPVVSASNVEKNMAELAGKDNGAGAVREYKAATANIAHEEITPRFIVREIKK